MSAGIESGIDTAVWMVGVVLGLAIVVGPLALVGWLTYGIVRRLGVVHRWRALVVWFTHWRMRRRWERERPAPETDSGTVELDDITGVPVLVLRRHGDSEDVVIRVPADATPEQINEALKRRQP